MGTSTSPLPDLLKAWMPGQRWFPSKGRDISLSRAGGIRLEDPTGEVGLEVHIVAVESGRRLDVVNVPLTFRAEPLAGAEAAMLGETEHTELGRRYVYDDVCAHA